MAFRLGEYVVYGELRNKRNYSTHGVIVLRGGVPGEETVLRLDLTGNCDKDLRGKAFRFKPAGDDDNGPVFCVGDHPNFQIRQIGPTGTMTAQGWVKALPCSVEEFLRRSELGEAPPTAWKRHLYLEWYGQNGRVLVEMADVEVEECVREPNYGDGSEPEDEGEWKELPNLALPPDLGDEGPPTIPEITMITREGDETRIEKWAPPESESFEGDNALHPNDFQRQLDAETAAIDRALRLSYDEEESEDDDVSDLELMDHCIDHCQQQPLFLLLDGTGDLKPPDELDDKEVEAALKGLLVRLAMVGVALNVCEHFTPRDSYRLLRDRILLEPSAYPELVGTDWVQHVTTSDYCEKCEAEFDVDPEE